MMNLGNGTDLIVFSSKQFGAEELRTSKVMAEFALKKRVYFFETPIIGVAIHPTYFLRKNENEVTIIQPYLPENKSVFDQKNALLELLKELIADEHISHYTTWTDTPKAMAYIRHLSPEIIVYDCLNDYSATHHELEKELFEYADVVLTSGMAKADTLTTDALAGLRLIPGFKSGSISFKDAMRSYQDFSQNH